MQIASKLVISRSWAGEAVDHLQIAGGLFGGREGMDVGELGPG